MCTTADVKRVLKNLSKKGQTGYLCYAYERVSGVNPVFAIYQQRAAKLDRHVTLSLIVAAFALVLSAATVIYWSHDNPVVNSRLGSSVSVIFGALFILGAVELIFAHKMNFVIGNISNAERDEKLNSFCQLVQQLYELSPRQELSFEHWFMLDSVEFDTLARTLINYNIRPKNAGSAKTIRKTSEILVKLGLLDSNE